MDRSYLKGYTPPTEAYVMLCTQVKCIAMVRAPLPPPPFPLGFRAIRDQSDVHARIHALTSVTVYRDILERLWLSHDIWVRDMRSGCVQSPFSGRL